MNAIALVIVMQTCAGCAAQGTAAKPPADLPTVRKVVEDYNTNLARLKRLWAHGVMEMRWKDDKGDKHFEQGDVTLVVQPPRRTAMPIQKLGVDLYWLGSDDDRYWFFDLNDDKLAYVGTHAKAGSRRAAEALPVPMRPADLPRLLGIIPIDASDAELKLDEKVGWNAGAYVIVTRSGEAHMRLRIDPKSHLPVGVDLLDAEGKSCLSCELLNHQPVELQDVPAGGWPRVATRLLLTMPDRDGRVQMELTGMTDDADKFNPRVFDFDFLVRVKKPGRVVDLDKE